MLHKSEILRKHSELIDNTIVSNYRLQNKEILKLLNSLEQLKTDLGDRKFTYSDLKYYLINCFDTTKSLKNIHTSKRYNWRGKEEFLVELIQKKPKATYEKYTRIINKKFPNERAELSVGAVQDYIIRRIYPDYPELKELRMKKIKARLKRYNFKGKEKRIQTILEEHIDKSWKEIAQIVNNIFSNEPVKLTPDKLKDFAHIHIFPKDSNLKEKREQKNKERIGYVWTKDKRKFLMSVLKENPTMKYSTIVKLINSNFTEGRSLDTHALALYLTNHVYREEIKRGDKKIRLNRKNLKRKVEWKGELHEFLKHLLQVDPTVEKQKINNIPEILDVLCKEFPEYEENFTVSKIRGYIKKKFPEHRARLRAQFKLTDEYIEFWFNLVKVNPGITLKSILKKTKQKFSDPYCQKLPSNYTMWIYFRSIKRSFEIPDSIEEKRDILEKTFRDKTTKKERPKAVI